jgi:hypothetical protein
MWFKDQKVIAKKGDFTQKPPILLDERSVVSLGLRKQKTRSKDRVFLNKFSGGDLLSRGPSPQVPSALEGLTAVFGMGTGVTPPPYPPEMRCER